MPKNDRQVKPKPRDKQKTSNKIVDIVQTYQKLH